MGKKQEKDLGKGRGLCSFFQGLIFVVRINYNLSVAKTCSAMTYPLLELFPKFLSATRKC